MEKRVRIGHSAARPNPVKLGKSLSFSSLCVRGCIDLEKNDECLESGLGWARALGLGVSLGAPLALSAPLSQKVGEKMEGKWMQIRTVAIIIWGFCMGFSRKK